MQRVVGSLLLVVLSLALGAVLVRAQTSFTGTSTTLSLGNDPTTGTVLYRLAKMTPTGALRAATSGDTGIPLYVVSGGEGLNPAVSAILVLAGEVPCEMDATVPSNARGMYVVESTTVPGACHPQSGTPTDGFVRGTVKANSTTAGQTALIAAQNIAFKPGSGTGVGSVTQVAMTVPSILTISGSPITSSGTLAVGLATQAAGLVWAGPATGPAAAPTFRTLQITDLPASVAAGACGGDLAGSFPNCTVAQASGTWTLPGVSPAVNVLGGDVNDYNGCATVSTCLINGQAANRTISGLAAAVNGRVLTVCNVGTTNSLLFPNQSSSSSTANRFQFGGNLTLLPNACAEIWYHSGGGTTAWRTRSTAMLDPYLIRTCLIPFGSTSSQAAPIPDDDDVLATCPNNYGRNWVITAVSVYTNAGNPSFTPVLTGQGGTSILTAACAASPGVVTPCTVNGTPTVRPYASNAATCPVAPCTLDGNMTLAGGTTTYGYISLVGVLQ